MKCVMCENSKTLKRVLTTIKYKECGLENVTLIGVEFHKCSQCGEEYYSYGNQDELHSLIAKALISKCGLLNGKEIRFLRSYLGYSGSVFAQLTGYSKETISRLENSKQSIKKPFDRLVRSLVATMLPNRDYDLHDLWLNESNEELKRIELTAKKNGWQLKPAA